MVKNPFDQLRVALSRSQRGKKRREARPATFLARAHRVTDQMVSDSNTISSHDNEQVSSPRRPCVMFVQLVTQTDHTQHGSGHGSRYEEEVVGIQLVPQAETSLLALPAPDPSRTSLSPPPRRTPLTTRSQRMKGRTRLSSGRQCDREWYGIGSAKFLF